MGTASRGSIPPPNKSIHFTRGGSITGVLITKRLSLRMTDGEAFLPHEMLGGHQHSSGATCNTAAILTDTDTVRTLTTHEHTRQPTGPNIEKINRSLYKKPILVIKLIALRRTTTQVCTSLLSGAGLNTLTLASRRARQKLHDKAIIIMEQLRKQPISAGRHV